MYISSNPTRVSKNSSFFPLSMDQTILNVQYPNTSLIILRISLF
jgi:hypothetical protein